MVERAESAPAEIVPGLLATTLAGAGKPCEVRNATLPQLSRLVAEKPKLVIAIERPPPAKERQLAIGIAGPGFDGNLTSDSTRLDGYVLSTDVAPTILDYFGVPIPDEMSGQPIRSEGEVDPAAVESLGDRMAVISERRGPVIGLSLLAWLLAPRGRRCGVRARRPPAGSPRWSGLSVVYLPLVLLLGAAIEPSEGAEIALTIAVSPLLAWLTLRLVGGYRALAVASGATVLATAIDVIAGSPLTALSLLGPNPGPGGALLRDRQRARGAALGPGHRRNRRGAGRLRAATLPAPAQPPASWWSGSAWHSSSPSAASAPTSVPRSCCRSAPPWRPR